MSVTSATPETKAAETVEPDTRRPRSRAAALVLRGFAVIVVAAICAAVVYVVSDSLAPTYESSATLIVNVNSGNGISDVSVTASNDLASQYAQLASSAPVLRRAARSLKLAPNGLNGTLSASTVSAQNLIRVVASAGNASSAQQRADAGADALIDYVTQVNATQATKYAAAVNFRLKPIDKQIADVQERIDRGTAEQRRNASVLLANLVLQRQQVQSTIAQNAAGNQPNLQKVTPATAGSKSSPKPDLYALIALIVVLLIGSRLVLVPASRRL